MIPGVDSPHRSRPPRRVVQRRNSRESPPQPRRAPRRGGPAAWSGTDPTGPPLGVKNFWRAGSLWQDVAACDRLLHEREINAMWDRMRRREFLVESSRAALSFSALPLAACSRGNQPSAELQDPKPWKTLIADLEKQIPQLMEEALVPGLSLAIIQDGKLFWRRGFGVKDAASKNPVDNDTVFEAASTSKPVFAYAVMKLCEKGVMDLDTPLTKYTSERFLHGDPRLDLITARHVLSHTSGFPNFRSKEEPLAIHFTPGEKWSYSGEGYSYLQSVVTHLIGGHRNPKDCAQFEAGLEGLRDRSFNRHVHESKRIGAVWNDSERLPLE